MLNAVGGVDLGGKRARICLIDPEKPSEPVWWGFEPTDAKKINNVEAARRAAEWARLHFNAPGAPRISVLWLERPFGRFPEANFQLSLMAGALLGVVPVATSVEFVSATECRKLVGLSQRASKQDVIYWVYGQTSQLVGEHDADSYVVARAVLAFGAKEMTG